MKWAIVLLLIVPSSLACTWALMVFLGVLHHELSPAIPAVGYWPTFRIGLAVSLVTSVWMFFNGIAKEILK